MILKLRKIEFDPGKKAWAQERFVEIIKCLNDVLCKEGNPFLKLKTSKEMAEVLATVLPNGAKRIPLTNGDVIEIQVTDRYTFTNPWFVQTFHGFDCTEILFDFSKAFGSTETIDLTDDVKSQEKPQKEAKPTTTETKTDKE